MNIRELLTIGAKTLGGTEESTQDAELLLSHTLGIPKLLLIMDSSKKVSPEDEEKYRKILARRVTHEPVAYIIGKKDFFSLTFHVEPGVLIPRPETELMVELALEKISEEAANPKNKIVIVDVGTGSGAIACAVAANSGEKILATEFSKLAQNIAKHNIQALGLSAKVELLPGNGLAPATEKRAFKEASHLILLANLPYIPTKDWEQLMPDVKDFEPREALDGGADGLDLYRVLLNQLEDINTEKLHISAFFEIDPSQSKSLPAEIKNRFPQAETRLHQDLNGLNRFIEAKLF